MLIKTAGWTKNGGCLMSRKLFPHLMSVRRNFFVQSIIWNQITVLMDSPGYFAWRNSRFFRIRNCRTYIRVFCEASIKIQSIFCTYLIFYNSDCCCWTNNIQLLKFLQNSSHMNLWKQIHKARLSPFCGWYRSSRKKAITNNKFFEVMCGYWLGLEKCFAIFLRFFLSISSGCTFPQWCN
jgi:hypothetical protein